MLISPISQKRYIKNDHKRIFIIFEPNRTLTIVNHQYSYTIDLHPKACERLVHIFDNEVENRRSAMELEIKSNVKKTQDKREPIPTVSDNKSSQTQTPDDSIYDAWSQESEFVPNKINNSKFWFEPFTFNSTSRFIISLIITFII